MTRLQVRRVTDARIELVARRRRFVATFHGPQDPICAIRGWWIREVLRDSRGIDWQTEVGVGIRTIRAVRAAVTAEVGAG